MDPILTKIIDQLNSSVFVLLVVLVAIGILLWKVSAFMAVWSFKHSDHEERLKGTGEVKDRVTSLEAHIGKAVDFGERIVKIETKLDLILQQGSANPLFRAQSPIALTDNGRELSIKLKAQETIDKLYPTLLSLVNEKKPLTAYDIQDAVFFVAREHLYAMLDDQEMNEVKNQAFNSGMPVDTFLVVYSILLRDKILTEKGIPLKEVDIHDPSKNTI